MSGPGARRPLQELVGKSDVCAGESLLLSGLCGHGHSLLGDAGLIRREGACREQVACAKHWWEFVARLEDEDGWIRCEFCGHYCDVDIRAQRPDGRYLDLHVAAQPAQTRVGSPDPERARALEEQIAAWQADRWKTGVRCR